MTGKEGRKRSISCLVAVGNGNGAAGSIFPGNCILLWRDDDDDVGKQRLWFHFKVSKASSSPSLRCLNKDSFSSDRFCVGKGRRQKHSAEEGLTVIYLLNALEKNV